MAISLITYFGSRRRRRRNGRLRVESPLPAAAVAEEKLVFFVAYNKKLGRYCYKFNPSRMDDDKRRKRKRGCCSDYQQQQQHLFNRRRRVLEPISDGSSSTSVGRKFRIIKSGRYVALGSTLYSIGGDRGRHMTNVDTVFCYDTTRPESGWKLGPPMIKARYRPVAMAIDGKLYVFGGLPFHGCYDFGDYNDDEQENGRVGIEDCKPWGEVFDPNTDKWKALPDPPIALEHTISAVSAVVEEENGTKTVVLVSQYGKLYGYNVSTSSWDLLFIDQSFRFQNLYHRGVRGLAAAVIDKTLYWYSQTSSNKHKLEAYNLEQKMWFTGLFKCLEWDGLVTPPRDPSDHEHRSYPELLYLGGCCSASGGGQDLWCLVWEDHRIYHDNSKNSSYRCIDFIKFRSTKRINSMGEGILDIQIESSRIHLIHPSLCFDYAYLM